MSLHAEDLVSARKTRLMIRTQVDAIIDASVVFSHRDYGFDKEDRGFGYSGLIVHDLAYGGFGSHVFDGGGFMKEMAGFMILVFDGGGESGFASRRHGLDGGRASTDKIHGVLFEGLGFVNGAVQFELQLTNAEQGGGQFTGMKVRIKKLGLGLEFSSACGYGFKTLGLNYMVLVSMALLKKATDGSNISIKMRLDEISDSNRALLWAIPTSNTR